MSADNIFCVVKNTVFSTASEDYVNVTGWSNQSLNFLGLNYNAVDGLFYLDAGFWLLHYHLTGVQLSGDHRNSADYRLALDSTFLEGTYGQTYHRKIEDAGAQVSVDIAVALSVPKILTLQIATHNAAYAQSIKANSCVLLLQKQE